jgi:hypothetical protein
MQRELKFSRPQSRLGGFVSQSRWKTEGNLRGESEVRGASNVYVLAAVIGFTTLDAFSLPTAIAQIPEGPGSFGNSGGGARIVQPPMTSGRRRRPPTIKPTPDTTARDTVDEMEKARARASGTPVPQATPQVGGTH